MLSEVEGLQPPLSPPPHRFSAPECQKCKLIQVLRGFTHMADFGSLVFVVFGGLPFFDSCCRNRARGQTSSLPLPRPFITDLSDSGCLFLSRNSIFIYHLYQMSAYLGLYCNFFFKSYLSDHHQKVMLNGHSSVVIHLSSIKFPLEFYSRSIQGPIFFIIFTNRPCNFTCHLTQSWSCMLTILFIRPIVNLSAMPPS